MPLLYSKSISTLRNNNGTKKSSFKIIKGDNHKIQQIKGKSDNINNGVYDINYDLHGINKHTGSIYQKHKSFKLKSSDILKLFSESKEIKHNEKNLDKTDRIRILIKKNPMYKENHMKHRIEEIPKPIKMIVVKKPESKKTTISKKPESNKMTVDEKSESKKMTVDKKPESKKKKVDEKPESKKTVSRKSKSNEINVDEKPKSKKITVAEKPKSKKMKENEILNK